MIAVRLGVRCHRVHSLGSNLSCSCSMKQLSCASDINHSDDQCYVILIFTVDCALGAPPAARILTTSRSWLCSLLVSLVASSFSISIWSVCPFSIPSTRSGPLLAGAAAFYPQRTRCALFLPPLTSQFTTHAMLAATLPERGTNDAAANAITQAPTENAARSRCHFSSASALSLVARFD
jgi:hypothetical protein